MKGSQVLEKAMGYLFRKKYPKRLYFCRISRDSLLRSSWIGFCGFRGRFLAKRFSLAKQ
jgi:hypothetical protein